MTRVLVIEDDEVTASEIIATLQDHGLRAEGAATGRDGLRLAADGGYDAIVLDRMLPGGMDGLAVLATLRATGLDVPVVILSAMSAVDERVRGLRAGGDDYITKPYDSLELTARLDALLRNRNLPKPDKILRVGPLAMDLRTHVIHCRGREIELLPREMQLLEYLMRHAGQVVTRAMIFEEVWGYHYEERTNVIDVHIGNLRRKIDSVEGPSMITTMRGSGYVMHDPD
ncbi:MAG: DNA-binding response regulator [Rubritepida sp.]|jgi:DNA-binding response OmpR family regulator|nr:DNA-binding response regulator [Rubritepida sp.]